MIGSLLNPRRFKFLDPFEYIILDRQRKTPQGRGYSEFSARSKDGVSIYGWCYRPASPRGTLFLLHGFTRHCGKNEELSKLGIELSKQFELGCIAYDARHHGLSENGIPTFGTAEMWDFQSVLNKAERHAFPKPFIVIGDSLGAMTAQRTAMEDKRLRGAFLMHPPVSPYHAIHQTLSRHPYPSVFLAQKFIHSQYGFDIISDGDIRNHKQKSDHRPLLLYIMGDQDHFDYRMTKLAYHHWYPNQSEKHGKIPCQETEARKWFVLIPGASHPGRGHYHISNSHRFKEALQAFLRRCLR